MERVVRKLLTWARVGLVMRRTQRVVQMHRERMGEGL